VVDHAHREWLTLAFGVAGLLCGPMWSAVGWRCESSGSGWVTHLTGCDVAVFIGGGSLLVVT